MARHVSDRAVHAFKTICVGAALACLTLGCIGTYVLAYVWSPLHSLQSASWRPTATLSYPALVGMLPAVSLWILTSALFVLFGLFALHISGYSRRQRLLALGAAVFFLVVVLYVLVEQGRLALVLTLCMLYGSSLYAAQRLVFHRARQA